MLQYSSPQTRSKVFRLAASGLLTLQAAIATTIISELVFTTPGSSISRMAIAQASRTSPETVDDAVVFVQTERGSGSGVIVESNGLIVTNAHVVEGARNIEVKVQGRVLQADVVAMGSSRCLDLALLQVSGQQNLPTLRLGDADSIQKRQSIFAIGYPGGLASNSASSVRGIISNIYPDEGYIQLDAPINPGNSGGAIVDDNMRLLGIATSGLRDTEGINFAISVDKVQAFLHAYHQGVSFPVGQYVIPASQTDNQPLLQNLDLDGSIVSGNFQTGDNRFCEDGSYADLYTFDAEAGQSIMIDMISQHMGSYIFLVGPGGNIIARNHSEAENQAAILLEKLPQTGTYTVIANTLRSGESGSYQLRATTPMLVENGSLDRSAPPCLEEGLRCREYHFSGNANQAVSILFSSSNFDPYLILLDANNNVIAGGRAERQAFITLELPADGWYTLVISNTSPQEMGGFSVAVHDAQELSEVIAVSQR
ncbi:MAG: S1C family serine protease [Elainellaceae cyanobacterium]